MNWGKGLALALAAFAALMAWFVVMASRNPEPLVTERYYEQELRYQDRIERSARALALSAPVAITTTGQEVSLRFPAELKGATIRGRLTLTRPNDPAGDRVLEVSADTAGTFTARDLGLRAGRYNALLEWSAGNVTYCTEEKLVVP
jgi:hypothetical protein